ncbi:MAG: hypothetical protein AAB655_00430 [Patescibacteria group bacterium]
MWHYQAEKKPGWPVSTRLLIRFAKSSRGGRNWLASLSPAE